MLPLIARITVTVDMENYSPMSISHTAGHTSTHLSHFEELSMETTALHVLQILVMCKNNGTSNTDFASYTQ